MKNILILIALGFSLFSQVDKPHVVELKISPTLFEEIGISFTTVKKMTLENQIKAHGEIIPTNDGYSKVGTLLTGRVGRIHVQLGQTVKKGDKLFEISSLEVIQLMDEFYSSEAEFIRAKKYYERLSKLRKDGIGSEKAFLEVQSDYEKSKAQYESTDRKLHAIGFTDAELKKTPESKEHSLALMTVKAPISGIVTQLLIKKGQFVSGEETLAEILNPSKLWARLHIYEKDYFKIKVGSDVEIISPIDKSRKSFGKIVSKSTAFMDGKKSVEVIVTIDNSEMFVMGSNINAIITDNLGKKTWVLPEQSVIKENDQYYVFVHKSKGEFEKRSIIIGKLSNSYIQILKGLTEADSIVENGSFYLKSLSKGEEIGGHDD